MIIDDYAAITYVILCDRGGESNELTAAAVRTAVMQYIESGMHINNWLFARGLDITYEDIADKINDALDKENDEYDI